ncbi:hypothetical protein ACFL1D_00710 [Candidatus Omnitrophota bacterium]
MRKVFVFTGLFLLLGVSIAFAQEEVTITTYYPSPHGVYDELESNKAAVGDTNGDGQLTQADLPPEDGQMHTARSVIFEPHADKATIDALLNPQSGELAYAAAEDQWYYYNGALWTTQAGGGSSYYYTYCQWFWACTVAGGCGGNLTCTPPNCDAADTPISTGCVFNGGYIGSYGGTERMGYGGHCVRTCRGS